MISAPPPRPEALPANVVVIVAQVPDLGGEQGGVVTDKEFGHALDQAAIGVRPREVSRELARLKKQAFRNGAQYRRFLKEAHFTRQDVRERVELQILSERIQERIVAVFHSQAARQKAFNKFISEYETRRRARTVCAAEYVTEGCSNGPEPKSTKRAFAGPS